MGMMYTSRLEALCFAAASGTLEYSYHYSARRKSRPMPSAESVQFLLCNDAPEVIEDYPGDPRGSSCLIWGIIDDGAVAHVVCRIPPDGLVITAYFPAETRPDKWESNYKVRR